ncbi:hypothetical protein Dsin_005978 [Dipteronia sinensis]|uniref:Late embryogenesis abundant protein LEA-2 subgroup domain-containing protein n=1 Tax=Dipteronia sinensis TaxID=43782 RepID=A0AAE0EF73_9ROSI|nr:hypothetical protein Dsin_005978 [Dipteronia sinensis]
MEERVPSSYEADETMPRQHGRSLSPSNERGRSLSSLEIEEDNNNPGPLVLAHAAQPRATFVIQIPKDQIYRVPPPENAKIVEAYQNPVNNKKGKPRFTVCFWVFLALVLFGAFIGITIIVIKNVYKPEATTFSIVDYRVTNKTHIGYEFTLKSKNPSGNVGITISSGGATSLISKSHKLSSGKFPKLSLEGQDSKNVHITLNGTKSSGLPKAIDDQVSLELTMDVSADFNLWFLNLWGEKDMKVDCKFKVKSLKNSGNKILSQKCGSKFK